MVPDKYIMQLVDDILHLKNLKSEEVSSSSREGDSEFERDPESQFADVESYLDFDEETSPTFGQTVGLEKIQFPNSKLLTEKQMIVLLDSFEALLDAYRVSVDIPKTIPLENKYQLTISLLDEALYLSETGLVTWDFCSGESVSCPLGKHCPCIELERKTEQNIKDSSGLLNDIIESIKTLILKHSSMELRESTSSIIKWNPLCMYIAGGSDHVPFEIYHCAELDQACDALMLLFSNDDKIVSCFTKDDRFEIHSNLQVLLSLNVATYEGNIFYVEPFLIKNGIMLKKSMPHLSN